MTRNSAHTKKTPTGHIVLAHADSDSYRSLRRRPMPRAERLLLGKALRQQVPRSSLGDWKAPANRPDPVEQIKRSHEGRLESLIPIRVGRMVASPYGFLRGTAVVMAWDVAHLPSTASRRWSAAMRTWATSASTPRPSVTWSST